VLIVDGKIPLGTINPLIQREMLVITQFIVYIEQDKNSGSNPKGKAQYIYKGIPLVPAEITHCAFKVIAEHTIGGLCFD
jgi:hypothetical protein